MILPITILTGFLGAGKTTLLKYLLENNCTSKIAIVENEFGQVSIDSELLKGTESLELIELNNGCICCTVRGDLTEALYKLLGKIDSDELTIDHLILETTGVADPAPIVQTFFVDDLLRERIRLDAVITLVDAEYGLQQLDEHRVVASQIGFADRIIVTKSDRVKEQQKAGVMARIHQINAKSEIIEAYFGQVPAEEWLGINAFELDDSLVITQGTRTFQSADNNQLNVLYSPFNPATQSHHSYDDAVVSHLFEAGDMDLDRIGQFMEQTIDQYGNDMLRYKGIISIEGEPQKLIVQGVHKVVGFDYGALWQAHESRKTLLVIIGRDLPIDTLKREFLLAQSLK